MVCKRLFFLASFIIATASVHAVSITEARIFVEEFYSRIDSLARESLGHEEPTKKSIRLKYSLIGTVYDNLIKMPNDFIHFGIGDDSPFLIASLYFHRVMQVYGKHPESEVLDNVPFCKYQVSTVTPIDSTFFIVGVKKEMRIRQKTVEFLDSVSLVVENNIPRITNVVGHAVKGSDLKRFKLEDFSPIEREFFFSMMQQRIDGIKKDLLQLAQPDLSAARKDEIIQRLLNEELLRSTRIGNKSVTNALLEFKKGNASPNFSINGISICIPTGYVSTPDKKYLVWGDIYTYVFDEREEMGFRLERGRYDDEEESSASFFVNAPPLRSIPQPDGSKSRRLKAYVTNIDIGQK